MSAHVLLNLLNELGKNDKFLGFYLTSWEKAIKPCSHCPGLRCRFIPVC